MTIKTSNSFIIIKNNPKIIWLITSGGVTMVDIVKQVKIINFFVFLKKLELYLKKLMV